MLRSMAEKEIREARLIETDDGFRSEVKGDKAHLKKLFFHPGMMFGHKMGFDRRFRKARRGHGHGFAPLWISGWWDEESEGESEGTLSEGA